MASPWPRVTAWAPGKVSELQPGTDARLTPGKMAAGSCLCQGHIQRRRGTAADPCPLPQCPQHVPGWAGLEPPASTLGWVTGGRVGSGRCPSALRAGRLPARMR